MEYATDVPVPVEPLNGTTEANSKVTSLTEEVL